MDTLNPPAAVDKTADENLSQEIARTVAKLPDDVIRCTRVNGSYYRCNWWAAESTVGYDNPNMRPGQLSTTHRIRKSQFLDVSRTADGLRIGVVGEAA